MRQSLIALAAAALLAPTFAHAQDSGDWLLRARAVRLESANKDDTGLALSVNNKWIPEFDITYFFTPNFATELILTYPQKHSLYSKGSEIATLKQLPPTLTAQYHFTNFSGWRPYVGLGINYTNFSSVDWAPAVQAALNPNIKHSSFGLAAQIGVDVPVGNGWLVNVDVKKVQISTDVLAGPNQDKVGTFKIDPTLLSIGIGKRF